MSTMRVYKLCELVDRYRDTERNKAKTYDVIW